MTAVTLHEGDNRITLRRLIDQGVRVHSVVCDPPYGLTSIGKRFGKEGAAPAKFGTDGAFARASAGFMGSKWDGTGIERDPEFWRLVYDILLPGGYVVAFSGSRTGHWQACAMETAGFIMHPMLGWVFGQGMPKAHNAAMAIDKQLGVKGGRGAPKISAHAGWIERGALRGDDGHTGWQREWMQDAEKVDANARKYLPGSPEAAAWDGWAYGGQALKPALEPIYVGQKPFSEKNGALNLLKHGVGAINIDGCRVSPGSGSTGEPRHPANLIHDGSAEVQALFPSSAGQLARSSSSSESRRTQNCYGVMARGAPGSEMEPRNDSGSAARFFNAFGYSDVEEVMALTGCSDEEGREIIAYLEQHRPVSAGEPTYYHGKAAKADRVFVCRICDARAVAAHPGCGCVDENGARSMRSHPTVKPIALMRWLVRLVTPKGGTVLDPFAGSGTTGAAARAEGFDCILMEAEPQFAADIRARFDLPRPTIHQFSDFDDLLGGDIVPELEAILG